MKIHPADLLVIALYFAGTLGLGLWVSRRNRGSEQYFLGDRNFPGWAIGISFIGAMISSVTFIALPADAFKTTWVRYLPNFAFPLVALFSAYAFLPFFRRGTVTSAYQYLGLRFGPSIAIYGAVVYFAAQIVRTASIVYLMAVLMSAMTGLGIGWGILIAGGITGLYTVKGGYSAVIWTDVVQTIVLMIGAVVVIGAVIARLPGGVAEIFAAATEAGKFSLRDLDPATGRLEPLASGFSLTEKTATMLVLVGFVQFLTGKLNQESVQRWCSTKSPREARKSMLILGAGALPIWAVFMFMGTCLWVYYGRFPDEVSGGVLDGTLKAESILPHFIVTALPVGVSGLVISAALAAAMSTLSSAINSVGMVLVNDIWTPLRRRPLPESARLVAGRVAAAIVAFCMIGGAALFHLADTKTLTDFSIIITAIFGGGMAGVFLLGMLSRRGDARAVLAGIVVTLLFTCWALLMQFGALPRVFDPYYTAILGNLIMIAVGYGASWIWRAPARDLTNLTVWDQSKEAMV